MKEKLLKFIRKYVDIQQVKLATTNMYIKRMPLAVIDEDLYNDIYDLLEEFGEDNDLPENWWMSEFEIEDLIFEL